MSRLHDLAHKFRRFVVVGCIATVVHYATLVTGVELLGLRAALASAAGFLSSAVLNYILNRSYTFRSDAAHGRAAWRFAIVLGAGFLINTALMVLFVDLMHIGYLIAQLLTTVVVLLWNFSGHALWTFSAPARQQE